MERFELPNGLVLLVHDADDCADTVCVIHNPLPGYDRQRLHWRGDRGIFEVICAHGVGHPAPEQWPYWKLTGQLSAGIHGCDGCCTNYGKGDTDEQTD